MKKLDNIVDAIEVAYNVGTPMFMALAGMAVGIWLERDRVRAHVMEVVQSSKNEGETTDSTDEA